MPRTCTICQHEARTAIEQAVVTGDSYRHIASQFGVSYKAVERHKSHILAPVTEAREAEVTSQALNVVAQLIAINDAAQEILAEARQTKDADIALKAIDRIQRQIELQAKLLGDLDERPQVNILISPEWLAVRAALLAALLPYPDARAAVVEAVARVGA